MSTKPELFIGIPTWNSELFLETSLRGVKRTTNGIVLKVLVIDNESTDRTIEIAKDFGCEVKIKSLLLPDALNYLVSRSNAPFSLFIHADTVLLDTDWFERCTARLNGNCILISPQDIGCGPFTRPWGAGMPESSFMLFSTADLRMLRQTRWVRRFRMPYPQRVVNFFSQNVTHHLPGRLHEKGMSWRMMKVLMSPTSEEAIWTPSFKPVCWSDELSKLRYGLGNFYSLDGKITHYHNWFERVAREVPSDSPEADLQQGGIPLAYISKYTKNFLSDYSNDCLQLPDPKTPERTPKELAVGDS